MKQLINYIKEELESDNILWLLDQWFNRDEVAKEEFINIIFNCQKDHTVNNAEKYLNQTQNLKLNLQSFINFKRAGRLIYFFLADIPASIYSPAIVYPLEFANDSKAVFCSSRDSPCRLCSSVLTRTYSAALFMTILLHVSMQCSS